MFWLTFKATGAQRHNTVAYESFIIGTIVYSLKIDLFLGNFVIGAQWPLCLHGV